MAVLAREPSVAANGMSGRGDDLDRMEPQDPSRVGSAGDPGAGVTLGAACAYVLTTSSLETQRRDVSRDASRGAFCVKQALVGTWVEVVTMLFLLCRIVHHGRNERLKIVV